MFLLVVDRFYYKVPRVDATEAPTDLCTDWQGPTKHAGIRAQNIPDEREREGGTREEEA